jgi:hypothetical protein
MTLTIEAAGLRKRHGSVAARDGLDVAVSRNRASVPATRAEKDS